MASASGTPVPAIARLVAADEDTVRDVVRAFNQKGLTLPIRAWAARNKVRLCFTPTSASWANPIEAQFGPLRTFVLGGSDHPNYTALRFTVLERR